jgi:hypothetical protein
VLPAHFLRAFFVGLSCGSFIHVDRSFVFMWIVRWVIRESCWNHTLGLALVGSFCSLESFVGSWVSCAVIRWGVIRWIIFFVGCMWASLPSLFMWILGFEVRTLDFTG